MAHHDEEFDEYVEERPEPVRSSQRLLVIILSVGCLALAVSNVVLAMRVTELRRALVAERPAAASAPSADRTAALPGSSVEQPTVAPPSSERALAPTAESAAVQPPTTDRRPSAPARAAERAKTPEPPALTESLAPAAAVASAASTPVASDPAPPTPTAAAITTAPEPQKLDLPPRSKPREQARVAAVTRTSERVAAAPSSPERSTAAWMVQEYGRVDAESRARVVADFYGPQSSDGAYWRRVLAEITATRR